MAHAGSKENGNGRRRTPDKPTLCVVDDDQSVRSALSALLRSIGFEVHTFAGGAEFMLSDLARHCDGLIADIRMKGMSGFELQQALADAGIALPVIFISGHADNEMRERALAAGAIALLSKPFSEADLLGSVRSALARDQA
jgi:FixJ family two-component response regulator